MGALSLPALAVVPATADPRPPAPRYRRMLGTAVRADRLLRDEALKRAIVADCDWITPEIDWKWNALEYRRDGWWFERADALAAFAADHGLGIRGHALLWDRSTPDWAKADMAERRDWALVERWFATVLGRYGAKACEWDVVNEPIDTEKGERGLAQNCFHQAFGAGYVARALRSARALAPDARLFVNEYGFEYANYVERDRRTAFLKLLEALRRDGAPIDGVGIQAHLDLSKGPLEARAIAAMLREIADLGLPVTITELDVKESDRALPIEARDRAVADHVARYLDVVLAEPGVRGVVTWGMTDRDSWLQDDLKPERVADYNRGCALDAELRPKPVTRALRRAVA